MDECTSSDDLTGPGGTDEVGDNESYLMPTVENWTQPPDALLRTLHLALVKEQIEQQGPLTAVVPTLSSTPGQTVKVNLPKTAIPCAQHILKTLLVIGKRDQGCMMIQLKCQVRQPHQDLEQGQELPARRLLHFSLQKWLPLQQELFLRLIRWSRQSRKYTAPQIS